MPTPPADPANNDRLNPASAAAPPRPARPESYALQCPHCAWSSLSIDVCFARPNKITEQLVRLRRARAKDAARTGASTQMAPATPHDERFSRLLTFYRSQTNAAGGAGAGAGTPSSPSARGPTTPSASSPAQLARIMSLYGGGPARDARDTRGPRAKPQPMREALSPAEGLHTFTPFHPSSAGDDADAAAIHHLLTTGWAGSTSAAQRRAAPVNHDARTLAQLWPAATRLRTRRGKRCPTCRQILSRADAAPARVGHWRFRVRLLALHVLPRLTLVPLHPSNPSGTTFLLTVRNPLFDPVRIALAAPARVPGPRGPRLTFLCPAFAVGPAGDLWDDALASSSPAGDAGDADADAGDPRAAMARLTGAAPPASARVPEPGKVWARTRDSTTVVVEVGSVGPPVGRSGDGDGDGDDTDTDDDDDGAVLEIPVFVRAEWEAEGPRGGGEAGTGEKATGTGEKVKREVGYWVVLGARRPGR